MKLITIKHLLLIIILSVSFSVHALKKDAEQPINITSDKQTLDLEKNVVTFTNNVVITQGSILINATKVTITRPLNGKNRSKEKIVAIGLPVKMQQILDDGDTVYGESKQVTYDVEKQIVILTNNAQLKNKDSKINAEYISYDLRRQRMIANKEGKVRVKTIIYPVQLDSN